MNNVVLIGFMGSGKTTIGRHLADRLRRPFIDLDAEIERDAGRSIADLFVAEGEAAFRTREQRALSRVLERDRVIIAAGGGAPLRDDNWQAMRSGNTVVGLMAEPAELIRRLDHENGDRPLLKPDARTAVAALLPQRLRRYRSADMLVPTDGQSPDHVAARLAQALPATGLERIQIGIAPSSGRASSHEAIVGRRLAGVVASTVKRLAPSGPVVIVTEPAVLEVHGRQLHQRLAASGSEGVLHLVPPGEASKSIETLTGIYEALAESAVDRDGIVIALGGGSVGDVAGFAAATWMRGIRYLHVPTTLLAMVDSSIGGKTAINLPAGKNMAGAVHQPEGIFADLEYLDTLPGPEYQASLTEIVKAALIGDAPFLEWLSATLSSVLEREAKSTQEAVVRAIGIKARIVSQDPNENGLRALLNYGHTVGHALERALGYGTLRHGEAVAWGMEVAARISLMTGRCAEEVVRVQRHLLQQAGLLERTPSLRPNQLLDAMRHDKKVRAGELRWVLLTGLGGAEYGCQVPSEVVSRALDEVFTG